MDQEEFNDARAEISNLIFTLRVTDKANLFLSVEDKPLRQQGIFGKSAVVTLLRAIRDGAFDGHPSTWSSDERSAIKWSISRKSGKAEGVALSTQGSYQLWLSVNEFLALVEYLKRLMEHSSLIVQQLPPQELRS